MPQFLAKAALLPDGWADNVLISVDELGWITKVEVNQSDADATVLNGPVIPGMPNLHSHAFQRVMAGMTEYATAEKDSFWTWRKLMYEFLQTLGPDELENTAEKLYKEMLASGYTHVGEFHYIHHAPDGSPYEDRAHLSHCMIRAAKKAGIGITILPVLYAYSGFGEQPPEDKQKRFINTPEHYLDIISSLYREYETDSLVRIGAAFHSLRAVTPPMIDEVCRAAKAIDPSMPIHIHIAEQEKEVEDCKAWSGKRPVEWLFDHTDIGAHWCLVHATHMSEKETKELAQSGAVAGLCPVTEANLGDGLFNLQAFIAEGGRFGIGSDSHISVNMQEELRWLEYGQRLFHKQRAIAQTNDTAHVGNFLYLSALSGGTQALGIETGKLEKGCRADFLVLTAQEGDMERPILLDSFIFAGNVSVGNVYVAGKLRRQ